jgi:hypothetical protein
VSKYSGNYERCPGCGLRYKDFRCTMFTSFQEVKDSLWHESNDPKEWRYKRKRTVLGVWHMAKRLEWEGHLKNCIGGVEPGNTVDFIEEY